jgi:hypothetical protein
MSPRNESPRTVRIVGAVLAMVWLCAGVLGLVFGAIEQHWLLVVAGLMAAWYGVMWFYVARQGRRLTLREALMPWRLKQRSNADA